MGGSFSSTLLSSQTSVLPPRRFKRNAGLYRRNRAAEGPPWQLISDAFWGPGRQVDRLARPPAGPALLGDDAGVNATADVEFRRQPDEPRVEHARKIVEDPVRHRLVKRAFVPKRPDVELQGFQLDAE